MKGFKTYFTFLKRNKLFTIINVAGLSVSLMFIMLIADMVTRQLTIDSNVKDADRIYIFASNEYVWGHYQLGLRFQDRYPEIEEWCAYSNSPFDVKWAVDGEQLINIETALVKKNYFDFFGYELIEGSTKDALVSDNNIVLTRSCALRLFGSESAMGKTLRLFGSEQYTVTGIMEDIDNSIFPSAIEAFVPIDNMKYFNSSADINDTEMNNAGSAIVFFKFVPGFDPVTKIADMEEYVKTFWWIYQFGGAKAVQMIQMHDFYYTDIKVWYNLNQYDFTKVIVFLIAGIIILVMAVSNYISMSVAQTSYRAKEMATRRLLGSSRGSVFWRMILESLCLTTVAFVFGLLLAKLAEPYAMDLLGVKLDVIGDFSSVSTLCWVAFVLLLSFVSGFAPASILSGYNPLDVVKGMFRRKTKMVYLRVLNVVQSGMTIALLACSIYFSIQIYSVLNAPLGYEYGNVLVYPMYHDQSSLLTFREEVKKLPFVNNVSFTCGTPIDGGNNMSTRIMAGDSAVSFSFQVFKSDSAFLDIFNIKITEDRKLANNGNAVYMSESAYDRYEKLGLGTDKIANLNMDIAGRFKDFKIRSLLLEDERPLLININPTDSIRPWSVLVEVGDGDLHEYKQSIDGLYAKTCGTDSFESVWYDDRVKYEYHDVINLNKIVIIFTFVALIISLLGLTAMNIYMISQRKRDIAVRKVFGASVHEEQVRLMRFSLSSVVMSLVLAIPLLVVGMKKVYDFVPYGDLPIWWIPIVAFAIVAVVSLVSVYFISLKATRENPIENIKTE